MTRIRIPEPLQALARTARKSGWVITHSGSGPPSLDPAEGETDHHPVHAQWRETQHPERPRRSEAGRAERGETMTTTTRTDLLSALEGNDDNVSHIAGSVQHYLGRLGIKVPRALCGVLLVAEPGKSYPGPDAPVCRQCADLAGWTS